MRAALPARTPRPSCSCSGARRAARSAISRAAAVDEHRHLPFSRELENRRQALVVEEELLGPWMELDPARAQVEAPFRLPDRVLRKIEPDEGDQPSLRARGECQRAVVACAEA